MPRESFIGEVAYELDLKDEYEKFLPGRGNGIFKDTEAEKDLFYLETPALVGLRWR